jgi:hypothetical protein
MRPAIRLLIEDLPQRHPPPRRAGRCSCHQVGAITGRPSGRVRKGCAKPRSWANLSDSVRVCRRRPLAAPGDSVFSPIHLYPSRAALWAPMLPSVRGVRASSMQRRGGLAQPSTVDRIVLPSWRPGQSVLRRRIRRQGLVEGAGRSSGGGASWREAPRNRCVAEKGFGSAGRGQEPGAGAPLALRRGQGRVSVPRVPLLRMIHDESENDAS